MMERYTARNGNGDAYVAVKSGWTPEEQENYMQSAVNQLADYEDAEADGKLIKLPFGIGTPIYKVCYAPQINDGYVYPTKMTLKFYADNISAYFEGLVYSDKTEAEQALERMKEGAK